MRIAFNRFPPTYEALLPPFYLGFTHLIIPENLLNRSNNFRGWMSTCAAKLDADSLIYSVIVKCDGHTAHKLSQWRLTAEWLAPPEGNCSRMCSKVSSDWLWSYIKATWPILKIFKMAVYLPDRPHVFRIFIIAVCLSQLFCRFMKQDYCHLDSQNPPELFRMLIPYFINHKWY